VQHAYYFSDEYLIDLFSKCGFTLDEICVHNKQLGDEQVVYLASIANMFTIYLHNEVTEK